MGTPQDFRGKLLSILDTASIDYHFLKALLLMPISSVPVYICICMYMYIYIYMHICIYTYMNICICTHIHINVPVGNAY